MAGLLEEIKQTKPFANFEDEVLLNLRRTADVLEREVVLTLKPYELTPSQYNVLRILRGAGASGLMCSEIGERMVTRDSDITRLLERLQKRSLITRQRDVKDRRIINTCITDEGLKLLAELDVPMEESSKKRLSHFSREMLEQLNALLVLARINA
jgi:MarR family transcriptional regulator, organic hydroperoxide resistance regulator